jgi:hypothetical protein
MKTSFYTLTDTVEQTFRQTKIFKREIERLEVRLVVVRRCRRRLEEQLLQKIENENEEGDEVLGNIEALESDISNYIAQLRDRLAHIEQGVASVQSSKELATARVFLCYVLEDARLWLRDIQLAREGYDELIENIVTLTEEFDQ